MKTRFILLNTSHAGNVGAAARAMKVMGFDDLILVAPRWANVLRREETIQRASGALDVLNQARIVATLDEALDGITHLCATAMTPRDFGPPTRSPREHFSLLLNTAHETQSIRRPFIDISLKNDNPATPQTASIAPEAVAAAAVVRGVAFLFGSERFGMNNEDVYRCHVALSIPTNPRFGSLNLASALQVIAYEWHLALGQAGFGGSGGSSGSGGFAVEAATPEPSVADARQVAGLLTHLEQALSAIGFLDPASPKKLMPRLNQLFNRAAITEEEIHILRGVAKAMLDASGPAKR